MKIIFFSIFLLFPTIIMANEIEVIELHETKTLDQMVLEKDELNTNIDNEKVESEEIESEIEISEEIEIDVDQVSIENNDYLNNIDKKNFSNYLSNSSNIGSKILNNEFIVFLEGINLDYQIKENRDLFYLLVEYFYKAGDISQANSLLSKRNIENDEYEAFYNTIKVNYLLATFDLENVCTFKNQYSDQIKLKFYLIEKIDIFCLILQNRLSEAELLNSVLIETETNLDQNFQNLFSILTGNIIDEQVIEFKLNNNINNDLIFLYSAMARIAEIPLDEDFLQVDKKNLSIPIILNKATPTELRIKAANESYYNNALSIESLAALYQSVDFDSSQLNDPETTIKTLSGNIELSMAYYYQLINIQIFPSERIKALIEFWNFSKKNNLVEISYSLSYKIVESIEIMAENIEYAPDIAKSYIHNNDYEKALSWINFYENSKGVDQNSSYVRILLNLHSTNDINSIVEIMISNFEKFIENDNILNEELTFILLEILQKNNDKNLSQDFSNLYDERLMPSFFIIENLRNSIENNQDNNFLIYSVISLNNKSWNEIHPEHLKILISGFISYKNGELIKEIVLEIFKDYKIL